MFCKNCGQKLDSTSEFCPNCGAKPDGKMPSSRGPAIQYQPKEDNKKGWQIAAIAMAVVVAFTGLGLGVYIFSNEMDKRNQAQNQIQQNNTEQQVQSSDSVEQSQKSALEDENAKLEQELEKKSQEVQEKVLVDENARLKARLDELSQNIYSQNSGSVVQSGGDYFGNSYYVSWSDLNGLSKTDIELLRNEIYARNGYVFKEAKFGNYFSSMSWYYPNYNFSESMFNSVEKANIDLIVEYEEYMGWR
ncbi:hypothetical protein EUAN_13570 [Andreesenia angusta]|uniref:YARHG domain-containing protein n=1 Tax=Andreesenia angusta TaxID=39480 RepID=A0A1S1V810_9FIRM|nr:YARHG domain-containing protein [Andreesenia angusta]OHW62287.1 hypothetical protein EUAN_13570 [Andreesenia angusta]